MLGCALPSDHVCPAVASETAAHDQPASCSDRAAAVACIGGSMGSAVDTSSVTAWISTVQSVLATPLGSSSLALPTPAHFPHKWAHSSICSRYQHFTVRNDSSQSTCSISTLDLPCSTRIAPHTACVTACPCISVNMLPGCELCCCVLQALKINVDMLKLIQLGLTFTNAGASQHKHSSWSLFLSAHQCLAQQLAQ